MSNRAFVRRLLDSDACEKGVRFVRRGRLAPQAAWFDCDRPAWLVWALSVFVGDAVALRAKWEAARAGWFPNVFNDEIDRKAANAIRDAIPWEEIAPRFA